MTINLPLDRAGQINLHNRAVEVLQGPPGSIALLEGPTGLGKMNAVIHAVYNSGKKCMVACNSRSHIDDYRKQLEVIDPATWAILKGHNSYVCIRHAQKHLLDEVEYYGCVDMEIPHGIPGKLFDKVSRGSEDCHEELCGYIQAKKRAKSSLVRLVVCTHHILCHNRSTAYQLDATHLIADEAHEFPSAMKMMSKTEVWTGDHIWYPFSSRKGAKSKDYFNNLVATFNEIKDELTFENERRMVVLINLFSATKLQDITGLSLNQTLEKISLWTKGEKDKYEDFYKCAKEYTLTKSRIGRLDRALTVLTKSSDVGPDSYTRDICPALKDPHSEYLVLVEDKGKFTWELHVTDVEERLTSLYKVFNGTVLTTATFSSPKLLGAPDATVEQFPTPFDLTNHVRLDTNFSKFSLPTVPRGMSGQAREDRDRARFTKMADFLVPASTKYSKIVILTSSKPLCDMAAEIFTAKGLFVHNEHELGMSKAAEGLDEEGGVGIFYTWHGFNITGDKLVILERDTIAPPSADSIAEQVTFGKSEAKSREMDRLQCKIRQGVGRGKRGKNDKVNIFALDRFRMSVEHPATYTKVDNG